MKEENKKKSNLPNLRFPEFEGKWEEKDFEQICTITTGNKNTQDKEDDGCYPFYVRSETIEKINSYSFDGEAILTAGDGVGVGKIFHYINGKVGVHQRVYILSNFKCFGKYAYYYFASRFYDRVKRMSAKNSVDSVRRDMIAQMPISLPGFDEQNIIARFLTLLDERITTQNKIIEQYKSLIKGLTHFALNGKQANIRLKDCVACNSSALTESEFEGIDGLHPVYGATGIIAYSSQYAVDKNSILVIKDGASVGRVQYVTGKYSAIGTLNYLTAKSGFSLKYIYYLLRYFNFDKYKVGSGIPHIYFKDYGNELIYCPSIKEQNKIARMLSQVDKKIDLEQILLDAYSLQKQYLLKKMSI